MSKKVENCHELLAINVLTLLLVLVIALFPAKVPRIILGLPFMLFFPGYALVSALFPKKSDLDSIEERIAFSFGSSIAITVLVGLIINYTPWGIDLYPILLTLASFILITSVIACFRRRRLATEERFALSFQIALPRWAALSNLDKALCILLVLSILGAIGMGYAVIASRTGEQFTEFYLLGPGGEAEDYPKELAVGEEARVTLGIVNHQGQEMSYYIEVKIEGVRDGELGPLVLVHEEEVEKEMSFVPQGAGDNQKVEFLLYRDGQGEPYATLYLFIDVREKEERLGEG